MDLAKLKKLVEASYRLAWEHGNGKGSGDLSLARSLLDSALADSSPGDIQRALLEFHDSDTAKKK